MDRYEETFETWNSIAKLYAEKFMDIKLYNESYDYLINLLPNEASVIDLGCGPGNTIKYLLNKNPSLDILGVDVAQRMIQEAKKINPKARFEVEDIRNSRCINGKFDAIISGFCIPYLSLKETRQFVYDCIHLSSEKGLLYLSFVPGSYHDSGFKTGNASGRVYFYYHETTSILDILKNSGYNFLKEFEVAYPISKGNSEMHKILIAQKKA